jgi:hypothetical protein
MPAKSKLPRHPPPARAPAVLEQRPDLDRQLLDFRGKIAELTLAAFEGQPDGREKLAALVSDIRTIEFQIEAAALAHDLAKRLDREAVAAWRRQVEADPVRATEGITRKKCCERCSEASGCIITGEACAHPALVGSVGSRHQGNEAIRGLYKSAAGHLKIPGYSLEKEGAA